MRSLLKVFWPGFLITLCVLTFGARLAAYLPDPMPLHFDANGEPSGFITPGVAIFLMPTLTTGVLALFALIWQLYFSSRGIRTGIGLSISLSLLLNGIQLGLLFFGVHPTPFGLAGFALASVALFFIGVIISLKFIKRS